MLVPNMPGPGPVSRNSRLHLASKVRMRYDCKAERFMLLYPPKGLVLKSTEIEVVQLCVSGLTVGSIIEQLAARNGHDPLTVEREVTTLLRALLMRGLIHEAS